MEEGRVGDALLCAISIKAAGGTVELDVDDQTGAKLPVSDTTALEVEVDSNGRAVVKANGLSLRLNVLDRTGEFAG